MDIKHLTTAIRAILMTVSCSKSDDTNLDSIDKFVSIPDANFESELINQGIDSDGIVNQKVLRIDIQNIESLDLSNTSTSNDIEDLTGIEGFVVLKQLYAVGNRLTSVDISKNTALNTIHLMAKDLKNIPGLRLYDYQHVSINCD